MDELIKRTTNDITVLTKHKNSALKFFGVATIVLGAYVVYLGSSNDSVIDAEFTATDI